MVQGQHEPPSESAHDPPEKDASAGALDDLDEGTRHELEEEAAGAGHAVDLSAPGDD